MVSKVRLQSSHTNLPSSLRGGGPVWPARNRALHAEQSVLGPLGPGPLPWHSSMEHSHQPHRQAPPSQKRLWPPRAPMVSKVRLQSSHTNLPSSLRWGGARCPARKRELHAWQSVLGPSGPGPLPEVRSYGHEHQPHRQLPPSQKRRCPPRAPMVSKARLQLSHTNWPSSFCVGLDA